MEPICPLRARSKRGGKPRRGGRGRELTSCVTLVIGAQHLSQRVHPAGFGNVVGSELSLARKVLQCLGSIQFLKVRAVDLGDRCLDCRSRWFNSRSDRLGHGINGGCGQLTQPKSEHDPDGASVHPGFDGGLHVFDSVGRMFTYDSVGNLVSEIDTGRSNPFLNTMDSTTGLLAIASELSGVTLIQPETLDVVEVPGDDGVANLGLARNGELLLITRFDGSIRAWDTVANRSAGLVFEGSGARLSSPSYYDAESDSMWFYTSGRILEIPLDPSVWVERACEIVGRELTDDEWERFVPGDDPPTPACI